MKKLNFVLKSFLFVFILGFVAVSCEKEKDDVQQQNNNLPEEEDESYLVEKLKGYVQKGPYNNGTSITISVLDRKLNQTGKNFDSVKKW